MAAKNALCKCLKWRLKKIALLILAVLMILVFGHVIIIFMILHVLDMNPTFQMLNNSMQVKSLEGSPDRIYYDSNYPDDDRIVSQMNYVPKRVLEELKKPTAEQKLKTILLYQSSSGERLSYGKRYQFIKDECPVQLCALTNDRKQNKTADLILFSFTNQLRPLLASRRASQIWVLYNLESAVHQPFQNGFNWTATYLHNSTIVTPYEKFVLYDKNIFAKPTTRNYAAGKTKKVAWLVSNCGSTGRMKYARELSRYIQVDIYGRCGKLRCSRSRANDCFKMIDKNYKFYLAFENSQCRDYITEKFFLNALQYDILPIVKGAHPDDYKRVAPYNSYIHVDDFESPFELANYLHILDQNDDLYNKYFEWKGTGTFINTKFWCRLCALANDEPSFNNSVTSNSSNWLYGPRSCIKNTGRWKKASWNLK